MVQASREGALLLGSALFVLTFLVCQSQAGVFKRETDEAEGNSRAAEYALIGTPSYSSGSPSVSASAYTGSSSSLPAGKISRAAKYPTVKKSLVSSVPVTSAPVEFIEADESSSSSSSSSFSSSSSSSVTTTTYGSRSGDFDADYEGASSRASSNSSEDSLVDPLGHSQTTTSTTESPNEVAKDSSADDDGETSEQPKKSKKQKQKKQTDAAAKEDGESSGGEDSSSSASAGEEEKKKAGLADDQKEEPPKKGADKDKVNEGNDSKDKKENKDKKGGKSRAADIDLMENDGPEVESPTVVLTISGERKSKNHKRTNRHGKKETSTVAPSIIMASNGTNFLSINGTAAPASSANASAILDKFGASDLNGAISAGLKHNITNTTTLDGSSSLSSSTSSDSSSHMKYNLNKNVNAAVDAVKSKLNSTTSVKVGPGSADGKGKNVQGNKRGHSGKKSKKKPSSKSKKTKNLSSTSTTSAPNPPPDEENITTSTSTTTTKSPASSVAPASTNSPSGHPSYKEVKDTDKLLAVVITRKGGFKGRRLNALAIEKIMNGKLNHMQLKEIEAGKNVTIGTNNTFVLPAGHYYFPHSIRVAGFSSP